MNSGIGRRAGAGGFWVCNMQNMNLDKKTCKTWKVNVGQKGSQKSRRPTKKPYTRAQIAAIAQDVKSGKIQLPDLTLESNEEWDVLWSLLDSGSSVDVVDMDKFFPGAVVQKPKGADKCFTAANGTRVPNLGSAVIPARTQEGDDLTTEWKMPR